MRLPVIVSFAAFLVVVLGVVTGYVGLVELPRVNALLLETRTELHEAQSDLEARQQELAAAQGAIETERAVTMQLTEDARALRDEQDRLTQALDFAMERNAALLRTVETTRAALAQTETELTETQADLKETADTLEETQGTLTRTKATLVDTQGSLMETQESLTKTENALEVQTALNVRLDQENGKLQADKADLEESLETITDRYDDLVARVGTKNELDDDIDDLRSEIRRLEAQRRPLVLSPGDTGRGGFLCTSSMEPAITCLDEATWLTDFRPEDIVVGTTIAFSPACNGDRRGVAHRVIDIEVQNGTYYYWPKGDNNRVPDGCWVPETNVDRYIIEIHRDVRPENAELRQKVNSAVSEFYRLQDAGSSNVRRAYEKALCWVNVARESQYPGHIPDNTCG